jgi:glutaminyl-peptide cyclotransferase
MTRRTSPAVALYVFVALASAVSLTSAQPWTTEKTAAGQDANAAARAQKISACEGAACFDGERAYAHVRKLVELGPRPPGSKQIEKAREYIAGELKSYGLKVTADEFSERTPAGRRKMINLTAELPGEAEDFIILASHYDTKLFKEFRFVGANDGGSSTGALIEMARALSARGGKPRLSYRFVFFDGEEAFCRDWDQCGSPDAPDNTYGSRRYVARLREGGELRRARALILLDMVGYKRLRLGRDTLSTPWLVEAVWQAAKELGHGALFVDEPEDVGGDDHEPFINAGVDSLDIIQLNSYPHWHTSDDTLDKISARSLQVVGEVVLAALPRVEGEVRKRSGSERHAAPGEP